VIAARAPNRTRFRGGFSDNAETPGDWSVMAIGVSSSVSDPGAACKWNSAPYEPNGVVTKRSPSDVQPSSPPSAGSDEDNTS
jgi:hypothetical protein